MEEIVLEFEIRSDDNVKFKGFFDEVTDKLESMAGFKKTFQKFQLSVDNALKKVAVLIHSCMDSLMHGKHMRSKLPDPSMGARLF